MHNKVLISVRKYIFPVNSFNGVTSMILASNNANFPHNLQSIKYYFTLIDICNALT